MHGELSHSAMRELRRSYILIACHLWVNFIMSFQISVEKEDITIVLAFKSAAQLFAYAEFNCYNVFYSQQYINLEKYYSLNKILINQPKQSYEFCRSPKFF